MVELEKPGFDAAAFLASVGLGRKIVQLAPKKAFFSQGDPADSVFYLQKGRARLTVVSPAGKEATIAILSEGRGARRYGRVAIGNGHCHYRLHHTQNRPGRDDSCDA
jgi:CRP-like cAMP-binding protein